MIPTAALLPAALAAGLVVLPARAQEADPAAVWERFVADCGAVVSASDPAMHAAAEVGVSGGAGRTQDGLISTASVAVALPTVPNESLMIVTVNEFDGGRSVQCMVQLFEPDPALAAIVDISRERAGDLVGGDVVAAGGPVAEIELADGAPIPAGAPETEMVRFTDPGFPPQRNLIVQAMPMLLLLVYGELQPTE